MLCLLIVVNSLRYINAEYVVMSARAVGFISASIEYLERGFKYTSIAGAT